MLKNVIIGIGVTLFLVFLIGYGTLYVALSGGLEGVILNLKTAPDPDSPALKASRDEARKAILSKASELEAAVTSLKQHTVVETDQCQKGQNNWKVHQGFAYRCTLGMVVVFGFDGEFREWAAAFDRKIRGLDWDQTGSLSIEHVLGTYYDQYHGKKVANFPDGYLVSDLPSARYARGDIGLDVKFAEKVSLEAAGGRTISDSSLREALRDSDYALKATFQQVYFEN